MKIRIAFLLVAACSVTMSSVNSASVDCAKAKTKIDKLICSDAKLSEADEKLTALYKEVLGKSPVPEDTKQRQLEWIKGSRNTCKNAQCLEQAYTSRISDLREQLEKLPFKPLLDKPLLVLPSQPAEERDAAAKIAPPSAIVKKEPLELIGRGCWGHDVAGANVQIISGKRYYVIRYGWDLTDEQKETLEKIADCDQYVLLKAQLVTYKDGSKGIDRDSEVQIFAQLQ
jgi:uncharacterized protein